MKSVKRNRKQKRNHVKKYSRKELLELMPNFKGQKVKNFKRIIEVNFEVNGETIPVMMQIDKNGQICDCTRIGNVFTYLYGRSPEIVNWEYRFMSELSK